MNNYFSFIIFNPFKTWWKARKYFKLPCLHFHKVGNIFRKKIHTRFGDYVDHGINICPYASYDGIGKIVDVFVDDVMWKDKWDSPRHERNPIIWILLFRRIGFCITFNVTFKGELGEIENGDMYYWEFLLNYLYYHHSLKTALFASGGWTRDSKLWRRTKSYGSKEDGTEDVHEPLRLPIQTQLFSLNKRGLRALRKELEENDKRENE